MRPMPELAFLQPEDGDTARELAEALAGEVGRQDAVGLSCSPDSGEARTDRVHVLLHDSAEHPPVDSLPDPARTILVVLSPPSSDRFEQAVALSRRAGAVFHVNVAAVTDLRDLDVRAGHLQLGGVPSWDAYDPAVPPELAVLRADHGYFDWPAALRAIGGGAVVLQERARGMSPLRAGRHLFVGEADSLIALSEALSAEPERLAAVREEATGFLRDALPLARAASVLIGSARGLIAQPLIHS
jgi:hypothetical protein